MVIKQMVINITAYLLIKNLHRYQILSNFKTFYKQTLLEVGLKDGFFSKLATDSLLTRYIQGFIAALTVNNTPKPDEMRSH